MSPFQFQTAVREKLKCRVALDGPSGAGKTWNALTCATALAKGGRIAVIDTERGSARLYSDFFKFDVLELPMDHRGFNPKVYVEAIHAAEEAGYDVIVIDSLTHAWDGKGGALEQVDNAAAKSKSGNSYVAWRSVTPLHNELVDAMLQSPCHIVGTMRSKMDYEQVKDGNGNTKINKLGLAPIQRAGMEYEFTAVFDVDVDHKLIVSKTRCSTIADMVVTKPDVKFFNILADWLDGGAEATERPGINVAPAQPQMMQAPAAEPLIKPEWTLANLMKYAAKTYGASEADVRDLLRANNFTKFKATDYIAAQTVVDMKYRNITPMSDAAVVPVAEAPAETEVEA